ncbi:MAG: RNA polymerase subunit sigma-24 [Verrucomicrobia bacterium]|nr:MAG: RNA polymerase subunit sigma-24 [Verrucomicrobiota bacterium]
MKTEPAGGDTLNSNRFQTTRWSVVLSCAQTSETQDAAQRALTELCRVYWRPVFALICRRGHSVTDAQDLTQDFFVMLLKGNLLSLADPARGRFRSLLRTAVENFLHDKQHLARRQKRGGTLQFVAWDEWMAEAPSQLSIYGQELRTCPPERIFDVRWAATVVEQALRRLAEECESRGRLRMFTTLSKYLSLERVEISYAALSASLGVPETVIKRVLHQLRVRYRAILREEVSQTVANPADVDDEIRYLCAILASSQ